MRYKINHLAENTGKGVNTWNRNSEAVFAAFLLL